GAGVLIQAERQLELADDHLGVVELLVVEEDVAPAVAAANQLALDLEVEEVPDLAGDADAPPRDVEPADVLLGQRRLRAAQVAREPRAQVDVGAAAEPDRWVLVPAEGRLRRRRALRERRRRRARQHERERCDGERAMDHDLDSSCVDTRRSSASNRGSARTESSGGPS